MNFKLRYALLIVSVLLVPGVVGRLQAQQESWEKLAPVGHSFTMLMPARATQTSRRIPRADNVAAPIVTYQSVVGRKRYVAAVFLKASPSVNPAFPSLEKFINGLEHSFQGTDAANFLTFDRDVTVKGISGKQYRLRLGDYPGIAWVLESDGAFYALMVIGADETDADAIRFLSSFSLGEVNTDPALSGVTDADSTRGTSPAERTPDVNVPPEPWPQLLSPISGGVLNGKAITLGRPEYPAEARANGDSGTVKVQILIDELGNVMRAEAVEGPASLHAAAVAAALKSRFTPTRLMGQPIKVSGVIVFRFATD